MSEEIKSVTEQEEPGVRRVPLTKMRKMIAKTLHESTQAIAQSFGSYEVDATKLLAFRKQLVAQEEELGVRVTVTDVFSKALAKALMDCPAMNAFMTDEEMIYHDYVNLGMGVAVPGGLLTVVLKNADKLSLVELAKASKDLVTRAKKKRLTFDDIEGATFTISSSGPNSTGGIAIPIVNTPQAGIVHFGASLEKPVVVDGEIVIRSMLRVNVSYDHRVLDGEDVRIFNQALKNYLENPEQLMD